MSKCSLNSFKDSLCYKLCFIKEIWLFLITFSNYEGYSDTKSDLFIGLDIFGQFASFASKFRKYLHPTGCLTYKFNINLTLLLIGRCELILKGGCALRRYNYHYNMPPSYHMPSCMPPCHLRTFVP
jgi:hypothetical protein